MTARPDLLDAIAAAGDEDLFYYEVPDAGLALAGIGVADAIEARGPGRFQAVERGIAARSGEASQDASSLWVGGFAFADDTGDAVFPAARWWRPERAWFFRAEPGAETEPPSAATGSRPEPGRGNGSALLHRDPAGDARYRERVVRALDAIGSGELEKVVVARSLDLAQRPVDAVELLRRLRANNPGCAIYAARRGSHWFLGATPERLLRLRGHALEAVALAGSAPRGKTLEEDLAHGRRLIESKKEQAEHEVAVRALSQALAECGADLQVPEAPHLLRLPLVQHLCSPIRARWRATPPGLFEIARHVHPSAAVCGMPRTAASAWLAEHEELDRGWYAGLLGWRLARGDGEPAGGDGELAASLRCARLSGDGVRLYAGAGIVSGSDPDAETHETRLKWSGLLSALETR